MNLDCAKKCISDYDFVKLFSAVTVTQNQNIVFENDKLKEALYKYSEDGRFRHLFFNLMVSDSEKKVDISDAINYCYSFGILTKLDDNNDMSMISYDEEEAQREIEKYTKQEISAMNFLCFMYYSEQIEQIASEIKTLKK